MQGAAIFFMAVALMTPAQQQQVQRLESTLMAPCCYTQTIAEHRSAEAAQMRDEVEAMVATGKSDEEIKNFYRAKYGETILVVPEGRTGRVAYGVPIALSAVGLVVLLALLRRVRLRGAVAERPATKAAGQNPPDAVPEAEDMVARIRRELGEE